VQFLDEPALGEVEGEAAADLLVEGSLLYWCNANVTP
jgi:hypothetical protein